MQKALRIGGTPLPVEQVLDFGCQLAAALDGTHARGIVHGGVQPAAIVITRDTHDGHDGHVELLPPSSGAIGSINYRSPEQVRGEELDARTDIFSLGLVLYEMATGRQAFGGDDAGAAADAILNNDPAPLTPGLTAGAPAELEHIITRALEKDRRLRYQSAADLQSELSRLRRGSTTRAAATVSAPDQAVAPAGFRGLLPVGIGLAVIALAIAGYTWWNRSSATDFTEHDLVVIADFRNSTGDAVFDDGLRQAVSVQIQQSPFVTLAPDQTVQRTLRQMARTPESPLDSATSRELCRLAGGKASVEGAIAPEGSAYAITLGLYSCATGESFSVRRLEAASKEDVLTTLGNAVTELREDLGESAASIQQFNVPITSATTASLDALKSYGAGIRARQTRGDDSSIPHFEQAIGLDASFALAYAKLSIVTANVGRMDEARAHAERAYALRERMSEYERLNTEWTYATRVTNDRAMARRALETLVSHYPGDFAARNNLGVMLMGVAEFESALEHYTAAINIAPNEPLPVTNAAFALLFLGRSDEATVMVDRALALRPDPNLAVTRWTLARTNGDPRAGEYEAVARNLASLHQLMFTETNLAIWEGRLADYGRMVSQLRTQAGADAAVDEGLGAAELITLALVQRGEWVSRMKAILTSDAPAAGVAQIASTLGVIGDVDGMRPLVRRLEKMTEDDQIQFQAELVARALLLTADGRSTEAAAMLEQELARSPRALDLHYYLGLVHERSGSSAKAIESYRKAVRARHVLGPHTAVMGARLQLALLLKQTGDMTGANEQFEALERQWIRADPNFHPLTVLRGVR